MIGMVMKRNIGRPDRILRGIAVIFIVGIYMLGITDTGIEIMLISIAGLLLWTCVFGFCPLYMALSIRTDQQR